MHQQLWGYKVEEKISLKARERKRLNITGAGYTVFFLSSPHSSQLQRWLSANYRQYVTLMVAQSFWGTSLPVTRNTTLLVITHFVHAPLLPNKNNDMNVTTQRLTVGTVQSVYTRYTTFTGQLWRNPNRRVLRRFFGQTRSCKNSLTDCIMVRPSATSVLTAAICSYDDTVAQEAHGKCVTFTSPAHGIHQRVLIIILVIIIIIIIITLHYSIRKALKHGNDRQVIHTPKPVCEHEDVTVLWNLEVQTERGVMANRPDIIIKNRKDAY